MKRTIHLAVLALFMTFFTAPAFALDDLAKRYVRLALELGEYDKDYVDAYLGPEEWREKARAELRPKVQLAADIAEFLAKLKSTNTEAELDAHRLDHLIKNVRAMNARIRMVNGETFSFNEEARLIYDAEVPEYDDEHFDQLLADIDAMVPGEGDLAERVDAFRAQFDLAADKVEPVFQAAVDECRKRTAKHIDLPGNERYSLELVTGTLSLIHI